MKNKITIYLIAGSLGLVALLTILLWNNQTIRNAFVFLLDAESMQSWLKDRGRSAFLWFLGLQVLQTVIFVIPGEVVQIVGGYVFGGFLAVGLSTLGIAIGSTIGYWIGYFLGRKAMEKIVGKETLLRWTMLMQQRKSLFSILFLFVIPGFPKDVLCYISGFGKIGYGVFIISSLVARQPGIIGSSFIGTAASRQNWLIAGGLLLLALVALLVAHYYRVPIMRGLSSRSTASGNEEEGRTSRTPKG